MIDFIFITIDVLGFYNFHNKFGYLVISIFFILDLILRVLFASVHENGVRYVRSVVWFNVAL